MKNYQTKTKSSHPNANTHTYLQKYSASHSVSAFQTCISFLFVLYFILHFFLIKKKKFLENPKPLVGGLSVEMPRMEFTRHTW